MKSRAGRSEWDIIPHRTGSLAVEIDHEASIALDVRTRSVVVAKKCFRTIPVESLKPGSTPLAG